MPSALRRSGWEIIRAIPGLDLPKSVISEDLKPDETNAISIAAGVITAAFAAFIGTLPATHWTEVLVYGFLAGAGSGFWNAVLSYVVQVKNLKKEEALAL